MPDTSTRLCLQCQKPLRGRTDKKFCDDNCRNVFNNTIKAVPYNLVRNVNNQLAKNRRLLEEVIPAGEEMGKTTRDKMISKGFSFKYLTHTYTNKKGNVYFFCYDYGYLPLEGDWLLVVHRKEEKEA
jgi:hypothetical protein